MHLGLLVRELGEDAAKPQRLVTKARPHPVLAGGCRIALVEDQIDDREHRGEARAELFPMRDFEGHAFFAQGPFGADDPLGDGRLRHQESPGDLVGGQPAEEPQGERNACLWRKDRMAGNEDEAQQVVAHRIVHRGINIGLCGVLLDFELVAELFMLALAQLAAAEEIDGAMLGRGHEPGAGLVRNPYLRPLLKRRNERVLRKLLGEADIAHHPRKAGDEPRLLDPENGLDGAMGVGSRHRLPTRATAFPDASRVESRLSPLGQSAGLHGSWPISASWRISHSPFQPGMCLLCRSMKRVVHSIMSAFVFTLKIA